MDIQHNGHKIPKEYSEAVKRRIYNTMATRYQRGIQKPYAQGYTTQWPHNTKGVFRSRKPKDIQRNGHKIQKGYSEAVNRRIYNTMATRYQRGIQKPSTEGYTTQ
jgi:hypothetical protein